MGDDRQRQYRRVGDTAKCPACGVPMDPEAYRCPRCMIYFCFKCRRRVQHRDPQFQCMNQTCEQYGKMLCNACIVAIPVMGYRCFEELVEAEKPGYFKQSIPSYTFTWIFTITAGCLFGVGLYLELPSWPAFVGGIILSCIFTGWLISLKDWVPPVPAVIKTVTNNVEVGQSLCCIACRQAVEHL